MNEVEVTVMYYYFDEQGNKLWTSNEQLALSRARAYDSEVYRIEIPKQQTAK
jgi:hypothetical protein